MKKAIHIVIIILIIFGFCLSEQLVANKLYNATKKQIEVIADLSNSWENNLEKITVESQKLENMWKKRTMILWTFISHKELKELGVEINRLKSSAEENNSDLFYESLNLVFYYLDNYQTLTEINLQNIF